MKAAIYARVSTETQEKQETIQSQIEGLRRFAGDKDIPIVDEYIDDGYSGELLNRPGLDRLRRDAHKGFFDIVLIHSADRLSRKLSNLLQVEEELRELQIHIAYLNRPDRKGTAEDILESQVQGAIAEYEKTKILERTRRGKLHKAETDGIVGGIAPYGYRYVPGTRSEPGHYEVIPEEARVVRLMFRLVARKGYSVRRVVAELTRRGVPTRDPREKRSKWRISTVSRILRNETYVGVTYYNKTVSVKPRKRVHDDGYVRNENTSQRIRPHDDWIPIELPTNLRIIDRKTFDQVQSQLAANSKYSPRNVKHHYLLRGLVKCGECDSTFHGTPCHGVLYYRCGNRYRTFPLPKECSARHVRAEVLESVVWSKLTQAINNPDLIATQLDRLETRSVQSKPKLLEEIKSIDSDLTATDREESRLLDAYTAVAISLDQLKGRMAKIKSKKDALESDRRTLLRRLEELKAARSEPLSLEKACRKIAKRLEAIHEDFDAKRYLLTLLVTGIIIKGRKVRIRGIIPTAHPTKGPAIGRIASHSSGCCVLPHSS